ncbi:MAG: Planctomycete cytochrome [Phycisphaerales bacterium]|nr:Planctomycete cytochrome [Phycisphaerales bacterium]
MIQRLYIPLFIALAVTGRCSLISAAPAPSEKNEFFEAKIRPLLADRCYTCHSSKAEKLAAEFRLDSRSGLLLGGKSKKPAIIPGDPDNSPLIHAVRWSDPDFQMPPKHKLDDVQVADLVQWVKQGALDPRTDAPAGADCAPLAASKFWCFQPPKDSAPPKVKHEGWARGPIDQFVLARMEEKGLAPVKPADKRTLIRRATFDLTGLPPTPEEIDAFLADNSPQAFEKVVDRLLASPAYGECWGRHWLDVARYADTGGDSADYPIREAYRYRDWVIASFNRDTPYDQFLRQQIAGDLIPAKDEEQRREGIIATGYLAISRRFSVHPEGAMQLTIDDAIDTMGRSLQGLTLGCARCHDHKFDPVSMGDYYSLYGIFDSTRFPQPGSEEAQFPHDMVALAADADANPELKAFLEKLSAMDTEVDELRIAWRKKGTGDEPSRQKVDDAKKRRAEFARQGPDVESAYAVTDKPQAHDAPILRRGEEGNKGPVVPRGYLAVLGGQKLPKDESGSGRRELADWIANDSNPLTARVMVNRIWQYHFGKGIVQTPNDFGARGKPPTHPELLDYLAVKFMRDGWSIKSLHRAIMLSATYQLSATDDPAASQIDPGGEYLWHFTRHRLDAEAIRDAMLAISGELDRSPGGPHPFPPRKDWHFTQHAAFSAVYETKHRSVYLMQQRIKRHPYLAVFDGPDPNAPTADRGSSTTPLQALYLMNDRFVYQQSEAFADRLMHETQDDPTRIQLAYARTLSRPATPEELADAQAYLNDFADKLKSNDVPPDQPPKAALASYIRVLLSSNEFMFVE